MNLIEITPFKEGIATRLAGKNKPEENDCPYKLGTPQYHLWWAGYWEVMDKE